MFHYQTVILSGIDKWNEYYLLVSCGRKVSLRNYNSKLCIMYTHLNNNILSDVLPCALHPQTHYWSHYILRLCMESSKNSMHLATHLIFSKMESLYTLETWYHDLIIHYGETVTWALWGPLFNIWTTNHLISSPLT